MSLPAKIDEQDVMEEFEELLCSIATGVPPDRSAAMRFSRCRTALLESPSKDLLPGFVYQCLSVFRFKDFITLYDPDITLRDAFIRRAFSRCRAMSGAPPAHGQRATAKSQNWMS
ncbi:hypothetical protein D1610_04325 [Sphingomonas gilva]|uniref:Uncharacterized protein n=1 Tax=Sphingomonas gilva TaxID=2305907 RepID=A0A396RRR1_9SPHN|nr:hypothetical protein [Sphingomonas gilva]RHW19334.1 hypothetical protein D1610_04325 [Sphingomonas gilva]